MYKRILTPERAIKNRVSQLIWGFILTTLFLGLLSLSIGSYSAWTFPEELISHFRVQYWVASLILAAFMLLLLQTHQFKNRILFLAVLALIGLNSVEVLPWYFPHAHKVDRALISSPNHLRILSANVNKGNDRYAPTIQMIRDQKPDIALVIETTSQWVEQLDTGLNDMFPYRFTVPANGLALWSRFPLENAREDLLNSENISLLATVQKNDRAIQFVGMHAMNPRNRSAMARRNRQLSGVSQYVQGMSEPTIVIGDLNLTPWSPYYRRFIQQTELRNTRLGFGTLPTYPRASTVYRHPKWTIPFLNIPIDHALVSQHFDIADMQTITHGNADHAAIVTDLILR